ncbi:hypothetical protein TARUN_4338 [Trichoderma arundinaceum]|uniref:Uncharacterized protein n=1 Tax=Trichoderma arundinaceum TaxID=490622 RepID=A0A395NP65_TRIAR|nr:hypothetical protein TARUN_4338 [Trichoderma arundinaceum]
MVKIFTISDVYSNEVLYMAEFHPFGWFCTEPLGARGGFILRNGPSRKDSILAATGDITVFEQKVNPFSNESNIMLPPLPRSDKIQASRMLTETEIMTGKSMINNGVAFQFSIEAGRNMKREKFEWRSINEGGNEGVAWELVRCPGASRRIPPEGEVIAKLSWLPIPLANMFGLWNPKPILTLELLNSLESGVLGERCALTVVMSALRLWHLRIKGKDKRSYIRIGEKLLAHGDDEEQTISFHWTLQPEPLFLLLSFVMRTCVGVALPKLVDEELSCGHVARWFFQKWSGRTGIMSGKAGAQIGGYRRHQTASAAAGMVYRPGRGAQHHYNASRCPLSPLKRRRRGATVRSNYPLRGTKANTDTDDNISSSNPDDYARKIDISTRIMESKGAVVQRSGQTALLEDGGNTNHTERDVGGGTRKGTATELF